MKTLSPTNEALGNPSKGEKPLFVSKTPALAPRSLPMNKLADRATKDPDFKSFLSPTGVGNAKQIGRTLKTLTINGLDSKRTITMESGESSALRAKPIDLGLQLSSRGVIPTSPTPTHEKKNSISNILTQPSTSNTSNLLAAQLSPSQANMIRSPMKTFLTNRVGVGKTGGSTGFSTLQKYHNKEKHQVMTERNTAPVQGRTTITEESANLYVFSPNLEGRIVDFLDKSNIQLSGTDAMNTMQRKTDIPQNKAAKEQSTLLARRGAGSNVVRVNLMKLETPK